MKINNVIISANIIHILVCDTDYGNVLDYISLLSLMIIMHGVTPISTHCTFVHINTLCSLLNVLKT